MQRGKFQLGTCPGLEDVANSPACVLVIDLGYTGNVSISNYKRDVLHDRSNTCGIV